MESARFRAFSFCVIISATCNTVSEGGKPVRADALNVSRRHVKRYFGLWKPKRKEVESIMAVLNSTILERAWLSG